LNSISRPILNLRLVEALPKEIELRFNTKVSRVDFSKREAYGSSSGKESDVVPGEEHDDGSIGGKQMGKDVDEHPGSHHRRKGKDKMVEDKDGTAFDLIIGCDGSWSKVRAEMMRVERFVYSKDVSGA